MIEPRKLTIVPGSLFNTEIRPIFDDKLAIAAGVDPIEQEALDITHKTKEKLAEAPDIKTVWSDFVNYVNQYKKGKSNWNAPIIAGMNIINFDCVIFNRMCKEFGQWDDKWGTQKLFHPVVKFDLIQELWKLSENANLNSSNSISLDNMRDYFGMSKDGAHDASVDVIDSAELIVRFIKLGRMNFTGLKCTNCNNSVKVKFQNALANWKRPVI